MGKLQAAEQGKFGGVDSRSNPITLPPDRFLLLRNWVPRPDGHLELREGYTIQPAGAGMSGGTGPIHSMSRYTVSYHGTLAEGAGPGGLPFPNGSECVFFWRGTVPFVRWLDGNTCPTATPSIRGNPIASSARWQYALGKDGYLYMHNGTDMKFFDGVYLRDIGLPILTNALAAGISVAEDLSAPTKAAVDAVTFSFETQSHPPTTQANAISGLMYMGYFDKSNDVLVNSTEPLSGAEFPSGLTAPGGYDNNFLKVNGLPLPSKPGAVAVLYYPGGAPSPLLLPGTVCNFYPRFGGGSYHAQFEYSNAGDSYGGGQPLPGAPTATFALADNEGLEFNPGYGHTFPGWTGPSNGRIYPMVVAGVNSSEHWDGTQEVIWSGATGPSSGPGWTMTVEGSINIPAPGDYNFLFVHDDGALVGFGDGAVYSSGYVDPAFQTITADKGYPAMSSRQTAGLATDVFTVTFPAAGVYHFEIDFCNWESAQTCCLYGPGGAAIKPGTATGPAPFLNPSFITDPYDAGNDSATLSMVTATKVNVHLPAHPFADGDVIVLSLSNAASLAGTGADYVTPYTPVTWNSNGPFTISLVDADNFTFNVPDATPYDGATPITVLGVVQITATDYVIDTDNTGWPFRSKNGLDTNQSGQFLLPSPLDPTNGSNALIPASAIGGTQPGYQFYASIYNPLTGHVGNRVPIGPRIANETDTTFVIDGLPDLSVPFSAAKQMLRWGNGSEPLWRSRVGARQGQVISLSGTPGDSEWCLLIGRTGDGGEVPYAVIDSAGNWVYTKPGDTSIVIDFKDVDGNSELPTENYIPPPFIAFWREGDRLCGAIDKQPFVYRSGSELDATTGIFVGDPAQAWNPAKVETFPTAKAIEGGFGYMQESWVFTKGDVGQLSELSGEVAWNGPYNFGIIGPYAFDQGWNTLPYWVSRDKQLCTMLPDSNGPIPISTDYENTLLQRIGDQPSDRTLANNSATATGIGTPQTTATLTPGNPTTLALFVSNADGSTTPAGWTRLSSSKVFSKLLSSTAPVSVSNPSTGVGAPSNEWANIIASLKTDGGTPAIVQHIADGSTTYSRSIAMSSDLTAGNCIIVTFAGNSPSAASGTPTVTDTQGNTYTVVDITNTVSGYHVEAFLAFATGCKAGPNTVTIGTTLEDGNADIWEFSGITASAGSSGALPVSANTELVYFRDPLRMIDALRIKCIDANGDPFVVIHDFNLRDDRSPFGQGYEARYQSTLATDFTSIRIHDRFGRSYMWAGGADARFYQFYLGGDDNGEDFTADAIGLRYVSGERTALKTLEWYGDENIQWYTNDSMDAIEDSSGWVDFSIKALPFPGDEGNAHFQTDMDRPEVIHLFLWAQLVSHPADAPDPTNPMALSVPPHMPLETYGRLYLVAPLIGDTRGR